MLEPKDRIPLPLRSASILRQTQELTKYEDADFFNLEKDQQNIAKEQAQKKEQWGQTPRPRFQTNLRQGHLLLEGRRDSAVGAPMVGRKDGRQCKPWRPQVPDHRRHQASDLKEW